MEFRAGLCDELDVVGVERLSVRMTCACESHGTQ